MNTFLKLPSFLFHPLFMPMLGVLGVYLFLPLAVAKITILSELVLVAFLTIVVPLLFLLLLKKMNLIASLHLKKVKERKLPVLFFTCIAAFIINFIFTPAANQLFFYFFSGVFFSGILASVFTVLNFKVSLHMIGLSGLSTFLLFMLRSFHPSNVFYLSFFILLLSWLASSRIYMKAHLARELLVGTIIGILPQFYFFYNFSSWLN